MKLKIVTIDGKQYAEVLDNRPVYVHDDGKESAFDAPGTVATISRLNGEAKGHREAKEAAEAALKAFEGITDPVAAMKALETVSNIDAGKLTDASKVEQIKAEAIKAVEDKYAPVVKERDTLKGQIVDLHIGQAFDQSKFISDKLAIPADLVRARFGAAFKYENGQIIGTADGKQIYSREKPGEPASFDEALSALVDTYPHRDTILKASGASGGGAAGGANGGAGNGKSLTRAAFDALPPAQQMAHAKAGGLVAD